MMFAYLARTLATTVLVLAVAIPVICGSTKVHAQDGTQSDVNEQLRACDVIADTMEKLACFDAVVRSLDQAPVTPSVASPSSAATTEAAPATRASDEAADSSATAAAATAATVTPAVTETRSGTLEPAPPATGNTTGSASGSATPEEMFGIEDVRRKEAREAKAAEEAREAKAAEEAREAKEAKVKKEKQEDELVSIQATIVSAWPTTDGRFEVQLDNGQVWRETSRTRTRRLPREGTPVVISKARFGSFKMKIGDDNRLAGVRRTK